MAPPSPIRISCSLVAADKTALSGLSRRQSLRAQKLMNSSPLPWHRLKGPCLTVARVSCSFVQSRKNKSLAAQRLSLNPKGSGYENLQHQRSTSPVTAASSDGRRNTGLQFTRRSFDA